MITKKTKSNFFLFIVILISIIFYFYNISQNKGSIKIEKNNLKILKIIILLKRILQNLLMLNIKLQTKVEKNILQKVKKHI